jgi:hypothetical protein
VEAFVEHRHLLPDEFDLLVDGEEGFGVAPLAAHVEGCATCRAEVAARRQVVAVLERLPHIDPSPLFAYRVMTKVQVFEPWYVPALDAARRFLPRSRLARVVAGTTAASVAVAMSVATVWVLTRLDVAAFLLTVATGRLTNAVTAAGRAILTAALGDGVISAIRPTGAPGAAAATALFLVVVLAAAFSLRAVTAASLRRRA